jgi:hypothetical protein
VCEPCIHEWTYLSHAESHLGHSVTKGYLHVLHYPPQWPHFHLSMDPVIISCAELLLWLQSTHTAVLLCVAAPPV